MKIADYPQWFDVIVRRFYSMRMNPGTQPGVWNYDGQDAQEWVAEAGTALAAVFPPAHPLRTNWERLSDRMRPHLDRGDTLEQMLGVFKGASKMIAEGRIASFRDQVRAEVDDELLDQAVALADGGYLAAAAVISGGSLETHLRHLVGKLGLSITGEGSISKYDQVIAQARNSGTTTPYDGVSSKQVIAWGGIRNEAAHNPGAFSRTKDEVRRMIEGIREFIQKSV